jgi:hypothetical protein
MRDPGGDEHDRSGLDVADLVADGDPAASRHDVVDLVLGVRRLEIRLARREDVQPDAQVGDAQELQVGFAARRALGDEIGLLEALVRQEVASNVSD